MSLKFYRLITFAVHVHMQKDKTEMLDCLDWENHLENNEVKFSKAKCKILAREGIISWVIQENG